MINLFRRPQSCGLLALCCVFFLALPAGALDFGLVLSQTLKTSNEAAGSEPALSYTPVAAPWVGGPLGDNFNLYLSGKAGFEYTAASGDSRWREPLPLPELDRSELTWRASPALSFTLGRQRVEDPAAFAVSGLFDGLSAAFSAGGGRFSAGLWYSGFLYKDTADIMITVRDRAEHAQPYALDASYFASRRALVSFSWENPGLGPRSSLSLGLLGQADLNAGEDRLHSQYLSGRWALRFSGLSPEASAVFGAAETQGGGEPSLFFAAALGVSWTPSGAPDGKLTLRGLYSSPSGGNLSPFIPVNTLPQGQVFTPALGGLSLVRAAYSLRPHRTLSLSAECAYFIRTDTVSFRDDREPDKLKTDGYFLGGELWAAARWTPLPDLALSLGGGAFFPGPGDAFAPEAAIRWKASLVLIASL